ncbi:MAG: outer membrane protein [Methylocystis sp.]
MKLNRAALFAPLLFAATAATGADLPRRSAPSADYYPPPPVFTWQGFYAGVQGGVGFAAFQNGGSALIGSTPVGGLIGVAGGYNYMAAPQLMIGAEVDFAFTGVSGSRSPFWGTYAKGEVDDLLTVRARAGYVMNRALFYVTAGFAGSKNTIQLWQGPFYGVQASFQPGWALGAGLEYMILPSLSVKGEYLFTSTGSGRYFDFSRYALDSGVNMSSFKAGLNYHF